MPELRFTFDPAKVKVTGAEILADLTYPVRAPVPVPRDRQESRRRSRRR